MTGTPQADMARRNARVAGLLGTLVAGMVGLSFAAVPLYDWFCRVTGFGGTTQVSDGVQATVLDRVVTVRFNADVNRDLPWHFRPAEPAVTVQVGQQMVTTYVAENRSDRPIVGTATFNVTPDKAGLYFNKIQCFCFTEQRLEPGQRIEMPVFFYVDPSMADDPDMADLRTITLSYTFFQAVDQPPQTDARVDAVPQGSPAVDVETPVRYQEATHIVAGSGRPAALAQSP